MNSAAILLTMATIGVDVGWQELEDGSIEYIIQIEPQLVGSLKEGHDLTSGIRPELRNIRHYRVVVGTEKLPQNPPLEELKKRWAAAEAAKEEAARAEANVIPPVDAPPVPPAFRDPPPPLEFPDPRPHPVIEDPPKVVNPFGEFDPGLAPEEPAKSVDASASNDNPRLEDEANAPPSTFKNHSSAKPLVVAGYEESAGTEVAGETRSQDETTAESESTTRPWGVLLAVVLGLFASLGLNAFLGWITVEQRGRYRSLVARNAGAEPATG